MSAPARVLVVCTGNVCRSPLVERLLRQRLGTDAVDVSSAGTQALVGEPMTDPAAAELAALGGDPDGASARQLTAALLDVDLVVTATREHRRQVVQLQPRALRRTFTLRELARLLDGAEEVLGDDVAERLRALPQLAASRRAVAAPASDADDVSDPYGRGPGDYRRTTSQVVPAVELLTRLLTGEPATA
ncbi:arsenate reductase/protein-tyrosine-phosphatase family protein [Angustibacter aerolatus]